MIRTEDVFGSELYTLCVLRIDGRNVLLEQEEEKRIVRVRRASSEVV